MNGFSCKSPNNVEADDFFFSGILTPRSTDNAHGSTVTPVNVETFPGLNTQGISMARVDFAPGGVNPPHVHPRASEIVTVLEGTVLTEFVSSNQDGNRHFSKVLNKGDMFVIPQGMIHYQKNIGEGNAVAIGSFSSQFPGVNTIENSVLGSTPKIPTHTI